ncbi:MAG: hypothetical protein ACFFDN_47070, partial [Candidatus Hodarchaeota archaeon]
GKNFSKGSFVILLDQPYAAFAKTLLGIQKYPQNLHGKSYDVSGHTLSYLMGITVIPIEHAFTVQLSLLDSIAIPPGNIKNLPEDTKYMVFSHKSNYSFKAVNRLLSEKFHLYRLNNSVSYENSQLDAGTFIVKAKAGKPKLAMIANELGIDFYPMSQALLPLSVQELKQPRVGLYNSWIPSIDAGWTRFVFEEYKFEFESVTDSVLREGDLNNNFDLILIPNLSASAIKNGNDPLKMPPKYCGGLGIKGADNLRRFVHQGGTLLAINSAVKFAIDEFKLPVKITTPQNSSSFWAPGPIVRINVNNTHPIGFGSPNEVAIEFYECPIFETKEGNKIAWYCDQQLLISGALSGEKLLHGKPLILEYEYHDGKIILFGFRPMFRAQTRGLYKLLFNSIFNANKNSAILK